MLGATSPARSLPWEQVGWDNPRVRRHVDDALALAQCHRVRRDNPRRCNAAS
jgi:hypothetical protein